MWLCEEVLRCGDYSSRKREGGVTHAIRAMSEEQLSALLAKLKENTALMEKLQGAVDLDAAAAFAKEAGFDVSKADLLKYHARRTLELSDAELEGVPSGGGTFYTCTVCEWDGF